MVPSVYDLDRRIGGPAKREMIAGSTGSRGSGTLVVRANPTLKPSGRALKR